MFWGRLVYSNSTFLLWTWEINRAHLTKKNMKIKVKTYIGCFLYFHNSVNLKDTWLIDAKMFIIAIYIQSIISPHLCALKNQTKERHLYDVQSTLFIMFWSGLARSWVQCCPSETPVCQSLTWFTVCFSCLFSNCVLSMKYFMFKTVGWLS